MSQRRISYSALLLIFFGGFLSGSIAMILLIDLQPPNPAPHQRPTEQARLADGSALSTVATTPSQSAAATPSAGLELATSTIAPTTLPEPERTPSPETAGATAAATPQAASTLDDALLELANQFRIAHGCEPLKADPLLDQAAQGHAEDLAAHQLIDHVGSDGASYTQRLDRVGYPYQLRGENIAAGYRTPQEVMSMWTEGDENPSGPHRLNILNCLHAEAGVGLAFAEDYPYWVLDLANRREQ